MLYSLDYEQSEWVTIPGDRMWETVAALERLRVHHTKHGEPISIFVMLKKTSSELKSEAAAAPQAASMDDPALELYLKLMRQMREIQVTIDELKEKNPHLSKTSPSDVD